MPTIESIRKDLRRVMFRDRFRFQQRLQRVERALAGEKPEPSKRRRSRKPKEPQRSPEEELAKLRYEVDQSIELADRRRRNMPRVAFDQALPIVERREEIARAIRDHQVIVVCGETGSGKSTQLPKICLELGRGVQGLIGHTQPRRIAARSVGARVAEELGTPLGHHVGYKIRFADETGPLTHIKLMTDGILLAESQTDRFFEQYDTIIIDEAHERSLNIDFLLGMLKRVTSKRRDLKVIITSATIDAARFAQHFSTEKQEVPVIEVSGRTYPIDIRYRAVVEDDDDDADDGFSSEVSTRKSQRSIPRTFADPDWQKAVTRAVDEVARIGRGDILIFMPTERDIHETATFLRKHRIAGDYPGKETEILPLYARLPGSQQQKVFQPHPHRRIVIATNVAESSLTVPGIRYVIDPGTARISRYSARSKTQRLPIERVSRASADQRAGRCGRVGPGTCIRLYSEEDYAARDRYTTPEIQRTSLASVILQTKALRLGAIESFPFLEPPNTAAIADGYRTLTEIGALDAGRELTPLGRRLARLPVDPRIGRMILAADEEDCLAEMLVIAAALEIQDPRERPLEKQEEADAAHARFLHEESDFLGYLLLWDFYHELKEKLSRGQLRKACRQNFLSYNRMREWADIHLQLMQLARQAELKPQKRQDEYDPIHRAILSGLLTNVAQRGETHEYSIAGGGKGFVWPGSGVFKRKPQEDDADVQPKRKKKQKEKRKGAPHWLVSAELIETTRRYMRTCARIKPEWVEELAPHLVKRKHGDAHWSREQGTVLAYERVTLFGLTIVPRRPVRYGPIKPSVARELFITHAMVDGEFDAEIDFFQHNQQLIADMEAAQAKMRRHDFMLSHEKRFEFYDQRLPDDVYDTVTLRKWWKQAKRNDPSLMLMKPTDVAYEEPTEQLRANFPDVIPTATHDAPLEYRFEPGEETDGMTITVPLQGLSQLDARRLGWLVPGLLEEKVIALLRSLPKAYRRNLVPIPDTARKIVRQLEFGKGTIEQSVAAVASQLGGQAISPADFDTEKLPDNLRMNIRVVDDEGETIQSDRDLEHLQRELGAEASESFQTIDDEQWNRDGIKAWDFGDLPEVVEISQGGVTLTAYPMLVDEGESVALRLADTADKANDATRQGLMRLFQIAANRDLRTQAAWLPNVDKLMLFAQSLPEFDFRKQVKELMAALAVQAEKKPPRDEAAFEQRMEESRQRIPAAVQDVTRWIGPFLENYHAARLAAEKLSSQYKPVAADVRRQIDRLVAPGFMVRTPWRWLSQYPRYFKAIAERIESLKSGSGPRDSQAMQEIGHFEGRYEERLEGHRQLGLHDAELEAYRWMIEEYRVSQFAQKLGTSVKVSSQRLEKQWERTRP